jgi:hypothetical protein
MDENFIFLIFTRFSVWSKRPPKPNKRDGRPYKHFLLKRQLFDPARLDTKLKYFEHLALPSILNQTNKNWKWFIYISDLLPKKYRSKLLNLVKPYENIVIVSFSDVPNLYIEHSKQICLKCEKNNIDYATIRLDDDDGLAPDFFKNILKYKEKKKHIISFTHGKLVSLKEKDNNHHLHYIKDHIQEDNAQGTTGINININDLGNHAELSKTGIPIIHDTSPESYYRAIHTFNWQWSRKYIEPNCKVKNTNNNKIGIFKKVLENGKGLVQLDDGSKSMVQINMAFLKKI